MNTRLVAIATAAIAGLLFGFDTAVISGVTRDLTQVFALSPSLLGITVSAALWGTLVGALTAGKPGDRYGSRRVLVVLGAFYLVAGIGCALTSDWSLFLALRFLCGLAIGGSSVLAPVYIAELAPARQRGLLVGLFQLAIVAGILIAYLSNAVLGAFDIADVWRWKLGVSAGPALVFLLLALRLPDSPRWLLLHGRESDATHAFAQLGMGAADADDIAGAVALHTAASASASQGRLSWHRHRKPILLAIATAAFNQFAGINAVLYYLNDIVARGGAMSPDVQAVMIGLANLVFTLVGMTLIDRVGRRTLLATGAAGMAVCLSVVAAVLYHAAPARALLPALIGFIAFFATSQGAVIWVYLSEIFPTGVRARGAGLGAAVHWLLNAAIAAVFPIVITWSQGAPFVIFAGCMAVQLVVVLAFFPETKRLTLEAVDTAMEQ